MSLQNQSVKGRELPDYQTTGLQDHHITDTDKPVCRNALGRAGTRYRLTYFIECDIANQK